MKTKSTNPINYKGGIGRLLGGMLTLAITVLITGFSQSQGNQVNPMMTPTNINLESAAKDDKTARNYVLNVERLVKRFQKEYQSASRSNMDTRADYLMKMNLVYEEFTGLKYSPDNPMVVELKRLAGSCMERHMNYIDKLIVEHVYENDQSSLLKAVNGIHTTMSDQMNKVKSYYSI